MDIEAYLFSIFSRSDDWPMEQSNDSANISNLDINFVTRHPNLSYAYMSLMGILAVIGIFGNFMVLGSICVYKPLRTTGNMFIANLAMADLLIAGIVDPFIIVGIVHGPKYFYKHLNLCYTVAAICTMICPASMWNVSFVAFNRYIFLCKNQFYGTIFTWRKTCCYCLGVWVIGGLYELPYFFGMIEHVFDLKSMNCFYDRRNIQYTYIMAGAVTLPLSAVCFSYYKIFMHVRKTRKDLVKIGGTSSLVSIFKAREQEEIQLAKTFAMLCLFLIICFTPFCIVSLFDVNDTWSKLVYVFTLTLAHFNNSANPILYGLTNKRFQNGYLQVFKSIKGCCFKQKSASKTTFENMQAITN